MHKVWLLRGCTLEWKANWPNLIELWEKMLVIPTNIAICERGFSKYNMGKSALQSHLHLNTLDALMLITLCGRIVDDIDWQVVILEWRNMRDHCILVID